MDSISKINSYYRLSNKLESKDVNNINGKLEFDDYLKLALGKVNDMQLIADEYKKLLATGQADNLHDVMIATEKANIALQLTLSIRNKVVEAYKEIMRLQI
jgi:flagellar hook-basal body complex protein FliE